MLNIEEKVEKLKITEPAKKQSVVSNKPIEQPENKPIDKSVDKNVSLESKSVPENKSIDKPTVNVSVSKPIVNEQQHQQKLTQPSPTAQHPTNINVIKPQSSSTTTESQQQKKPILDGALSKSESKNITYEVEYLKTLQYVVQSTQKPNFNINSKIEIVLDEPRSKNDHQFNDFEPNFLRQPVSIDFF